MVIRVECRQSPEMCAHYRQYTGGLTCDAPVAAEKTPPDDDGSVSGARFPGGRWKEMIAPCRSNAVGSGPMEGFMIEARLLTCR